jgi:hypothetical protein
MELKSSLFLTPQTWEPMSGSTSPFVLSFPSYLCVCIACVSAYLSYYLTNSFILFLLILKIFSSTFCMIILKMVSALKTSKLSFKKLAQVPQDSGASFGHEGGYSCIRTKASSAGSLFGQRYQLQTGTVAGQDKKEMGVGGGRSWE